MRKSFQRKSTGFPFPSEIRYTYHLSLAFSCSVENVVQCDNFKRQSFNFLLSPNQHFLCPQSPFRFILYSSCGIANSGSKCGYPSLKPNTYFMFHQMYACLLLIPIYTLCIPLPTNSKFSINPSSSIATVMELTLIMMFRYKWFIILIARKKNKENK